MSKTMKIFERIVGQPHAVEALKAAIKSSHYVKNQTNQMTNTWLFTGPKGSGTLLTAKIFAASLLCEKDGCGNCIDCETAIKGAHLDIEIIEKSGKAIKISEVRELISRSILSPAVGKWRIVIIQEAELLTEAAANALLKIVEEPSLSTIWILCTTSDNEIPSTLKSRCRNLRFRTPSNLEIKNYLVYYGVKEDVADYVSKISQGNIGRAKYLATHPMAIERRNTIIQLATDVDSVTKAYHFAKEFIDISNLEDESAVESEYNFGEASSLTKAVTEIHELNKWNSSAKSTRSEKSSNSKNIQKILLTDLLGLYRDILISQINCNVELINQNIVGKINALGLKISMNETILRMKKINEVIESLGSNVNSLVIIEHLMVNIRVPS